MRAYNTPELRELGSFASLTLGNHGSCPDGGGRNNDQHGTATGCSNADSSS